MSDIDWLLQRKSVPGGCLLKCEERNSISKPHLTIFLSTLRGVTKNIRRLVCHLVFDGLQAFNMASFSLEHLRAHTNNFHSPPPAGKPINMHSCPDFVPKENPTEAAIEIPSTCLDSANPYSLLLQLLQEKVLCARSSMMLPSTVSTKDWVRVSCSLPTGMEGGTSRQQSNRVVCSSTH
jgi:hypothetical protein